jgi:ABC-type branched-subunit amino acid transport system substrate-binding protein
MRVRGVAVLVAAALIAVSCGNADDDDSTSPTPGVTGDATAVDDEQLDENIPSDEVGVTDDEIRVSVIASKTNPIGGKYAELADGINAYFEMMNSEGGIYGRELTVAKVRDDQLGSNLREAQATVAQDNVFAVFIAVLLFTGADVLAQEGVPTFGWNINPEWIGPENFFPNAGALCFGCTGKVLPWLVREIGATKVGIIGYGNSAQSKLCSSGNRDSFDKYDVGAEVAYFDDSLAFGVTDLSAQVADMKREGVDFVTTCMDLNGVFTLAQEMRKQGLDAVQSLPNGYDQEFIAANAEAFEGYYVVPQFTAFEHEPQPESMQQFFEWMERTDKEVVETSFHGWIAAHQFVTGLKMAGPEFTRESVTAALNTLTDYTADGLIAPIDWTKQHQDPAENPDVRADQQCANFTIAEGGELVSVFAEEGRPWVCLPGEQPENTEIPENPERVSFVGE